jgi:HAD superfamily phosphoserine phosphatase-like hydrolase
LHFSRIHTILNTMTNRENNAPLHIFDADGTLLAGSIVERAYWELIERGVFEPSEQTIAQLHGLRDNHGSWEYIGPLIKSYIDQKREKPVRDIARIAEELAEIDQGSIFPEMKKEIEKRKAEDGAVLAIISGSPDVFVRALAKRLGFDFATGSKFYKKGRIYHPYKTHEGRDKNKHLYAKSMIRRLGSGAFIAGAYGDSMGDLTLLAHATEPCAVNPITELRTIALERDWRILDCVQ